MSRSMLFTRLVAAIFGAGRDAAANDIPCPVKQATWTVRAAAGAVVDGGSGRRTDEALQRVHQRKGVDHLPLREERI